MTARPVRSEVGQASPKPRERQDWRERKRINAARAAAQREALAMVRVEPPPLPADDDEAGWRDLICSLPRFDPHAQSDGAEFVPEAARDAIEWIQDNVTHLEGAKAGQNFVLERWQRAAVANAFGWIRPDGTRRFREVLIYVPKKAGKSTLVMALTLYLFVKDDEMGAKVYCAAAAQKQARIIWDACKLQLSRIDPTEAVASRFQHSIVKPDGGFLKPIASDIKTEDGFNPHAFVLDELHRQPNAKLVNTARLSSKTRSQPMMIYLTTADEDRDSVCNDMWRRALRVLANGGDRDRPGWEPRFLPVVYQAEPEDDWTSPATWRKAAPSLGVTISEEDYAEECRLAREDPTLEADFKRYMLNLRTRTAVRAFDLAKWDACREDYTEQSLEQKGGVGPECIAGLDLSSTTDITALVLLFLGSGRTLSWYWVPEEAAKRRDKGNDPMYLRWGAQRPGRRPLLTLTEGDQLDERRVTADVVSILRRFRVREVGIDPYNALRYEQALQAAGLRVLEVEQNIRVQSEPLKKLSTMIGAREIRHDGNPVLRWMIGNAEVGKDHKDSWTLRKPKGADKVDGVAALVNAVARMLVQPAPRAAPSVRLL